MAELKTFLFTDVCGSVRLKSEMTGRSVTERDVAFIQKILTPHRQRIEERLVEFGGRVVSTAGDGHFLVFGNTIQAALWAVAVQESHRDDPISTPHEDVVEVRMSVHTGVPQVDPGDPDNFVGKSVDYAARLNDYATGGQILVSRSVMAILDDVGLEGLRLHLHGRRSLKGIGLVEVHELQYDDKGPRKLRSQPKSEDDRQWTVVPTVGFEGNTTGGHSASRHDGPPARVGNYELDELLGSGGMGDVYRARHVQFGRVRAVKVIKPQYVSDDHQEIKRRFYNEITAVGRLEHKNIVVAIDSSSPNDDIHYLVMEYIEGVGLDQLVAQHGPLSIPDACEIIRQAARGLDYIHRNDMVHRDIKPSNLMLSVVDGDQLHSDSSLSQLGAAERGVVKILDLGLALLADDSQDRLTRFDNKAMGTGMYMSPEQWKTTSVDIRADIYSLGCTLYHILSGNPPFFDSDLRPEKAHEKSSVPPIRTGGQALPRKLWDVLRKMLAKRPEDRYATPAEAAAALAPFAEGHDLPALYRGFQQADPEQPAQSRIVTPSSSQADSLWSRMRGSSTELFTSRRWLLGTALPIGLIVALVGGTLWVMNESRKQTVAIAEADAQQDLPAFARTAATGKLSDNIAARFEMLVELARDEALVAALLALGDSTDGDAQREALDVWISRISHAAGDMQVDSWFVNDREGYQVARSPQGDTIGKRFNKRDYFHGQGRDLTVQAEIEQATPTNQPHLSAVYESSSSGKLKVAFSVPIWDRAEDASSIDDRTVIGVLAMSVNVADFEVLEQDQKGSNEIVLIDLRADGIDGEPKRGLILHHPDQRQGAQARISSELLAEITAAKPFDARFRSADAFLSGYSDSLDDDASVTYWGAFAPVEIDYADRQLQSVEELQRPGWVVLVQKPMLK